MAKRDLTGERFGRLVVLYEHPEPYRSPAGVATRRWVCRCDCGREIVVLQNALTAKRAGTKSCGCARAETSRARAIPMIGERYGRLIVVSECSLVRPERDGNRRGLVCRCDCGNEIVTTRRQLLGGLQSCGCLRNEIGAEHIRSGTLTHTDGTQLSAIRPDRSANRNSQSGIKGVYYNKREQRWIAKLTFRGKTMTLGRFKTAEEAKAARSAAEEMYYRPIIEKNAGRDCVEANADAEQRNVQEEEQ